MMSRTWVYRYNDYKNVHIGLYTRVPFNMLKALWQYIGVGVHWFHFAPPFTSIPTTLVEFIAN